MAAEQCEVPTNGSQSHFTGRHHGEAISQSEGEQREAISSTQRLRGGQQDGHVLVGPDQIQEFRANQ